MPIAQGIRQISAHAHQNDLLRKMGPLEADHCPPLLSLSHDKERAYSKCATNENLRQNLRRSRKSACVLRRPRQSSLSPVATLRAPAQYGLAFLPGGMTATWLPLGRQAAPPWGSRGRASASAKTSTTSAGRGAACHRIWAKRSTRWGASSLATTVARFQTQPTAWSPRRTVQVETTR